VGGPVVGGQSAKEGKKREGQWGIDGRSVKIDSRATLHMTAPNMDHEFWSINMTSRVIL
jgi:hypothetical protein